MKCADCKFAVEQPPNPQNVLERTFMCKRFPPTATKLPGPQGQMLMLMAQPMMQPDDYCHEFAPKLTDA